MPYQIIKFYNGYKVCKADNNNICFSHKPLTKNQAIKQLYAIQMSEYKKLIKLIKTQKGLN